MVRRTLAAALTELGKVGYGALRIEDVAARARVNKTTVYRRWPTKEALIRSALLSIAECHTTMIAPDTGSLLEDLKSIVRAYVAITHSPEGNVIKRVLTADTTDPEIRAIARSVQAIYDAAPRAVLERASKRGELRPGADPALLLDLLRYGCSRARMVDERLVETVVDLLLLGALKGETPRSSRY